ncbi:MAG: hypothetical protein J0H68_01630 [Sphingobacteriia bacterium]|nr:hypothetical protein [Sphingobacteriia bacterium]
MHCGDYIVYLLSGTKAFFPQALAGNSKMPLTGSCYGLSIDWLNYTSNNPQKNYLTDKYNIKSEIKVKFKFPEGLCFYHKINSDNFYNRINFYQALKYKLLDEKYEVKSNFPFLNNKEIPDASNILFWNDSKLIFKPNTSIGHMTAYRIANTEDGFKYIYFDPNAGEYEGKIFKTKEEAKSELQSFVAKQMDKCLGFKAKGCFVVNNPESFIKDAKYLWKLNKPGITNKGIGENSLNSKEIEGFILEKYNINVSTLYDVEHVNNPENIDFDYIQ